MFVLNCFDFHIMQEYKKKTNRGKTTHDVIDRTSAAVACGQCSRDIQASICHRLTQNGATFNANDVVFGLSQPKLLGVQSGVSDSSDK